MSISRFLIGLALFVSVGGLTAAYLYMVRRVQRDGPEQLGQYRPGAKKRLRIATALLVLMLLTEGGLFELGVLIDDRAVGATLAVFGLIAWSVVGFFLAIRDEKRHGAL